jgi:transposase
MYRRSTRSYDPFWMNAKFSSKCSCGKQISKGDKIYYYPNGRTAVCESCGKQGERDLRAEMSMDSYGTDIYSGAF